MAALVAALPRIIIDLPIFTLIYELDDLCLLQTSWNSEWKIACMDYAKVLYRTQPKQYGRPSSDDTRTTPSEYG